MMTVICYTGVDFQFGLLHCVRYEWNLITTGFVMLGFCSIYSLRTVTLAQLKNKISFVILGTSCYGRLLYQSYTVMSVEVVECRA